MGIEGVFGGVDNFNIWIIGKYVGNYFLYKLRVVNN